MSPDLALVHDYLTQRGGAERVVAGWLDLFPEATLHTALYDADATFTNFSQARIKTSWLNNVTFLRRSHRWCFPLLAPTMSHFRVEADVVLASSSGWAHGVKTDGKLIVYCHAPARWLYQRDRYLARGQLGRVAGTASYFGGSLLRKWDQRAAQRADAYIANSTFTQRMLKSVYNIDATVIHPFVSPPATLPNVTARNDVLIVARLLAYKNIELMCEVARSLPHLSFRIVGDGPLRESLETNASSNVTFCGRVSDEILWQEYVNARVHLALSYEDFGITPLEAAYAGIPTVARNSGGYVDTITSATGILVDDNSLGVDSIAAAVTTALARTWNPIVLRQHAENFSLERHGQKIDQVISSLLTTP